MIDDDNLATAETAGSPFADQDGDGSSADDARIAALEAELAEAKASVTRRCLSASLVDVINDPNGSSQPCRLGA